MMDSLDWNNGVAMIPLFPMFIPVRTPIPVLGSIKPFCPVVGVITLGVLRGVRVVMLVAIPPVGSLYSLVALGFCTCVRGIPLGVNPRSINTLFAAFGVMLSAVVVLVLS